jgi:mono/diheme cytochrome c family protein
MRHSGVAIAAIVVLAAASASAQQPDLNDSQKLGQSLFVQSCGVCHLQPQLGAARFAPALSRDSASGNEDGMRQIISSGSPRMPGFKYLFTEPQITAIASYLKSVPPRAPEAPPAAKREGRDAD